MDGCTRPGKLLAYLLAEQDMSVKAFCERSGMEHADAWRLLSGRLSVTPVLAEKLGAVFHTPRFWIIRQAMWELISSRSPIASS